MEKGPLQAKSYALALKIVQLCRVLHDERKEYVLSRQLLRAGTSVGANVKEAQYASSKKDFVAKLAIALKEAHETHYWLELLRDGGYVDDKEITELLEAAGEVISLLTSILKTSRRNISRQP